MSEHTQALLKRGAETLSDQFELLKAVSGDLSADDVLVRLFFLGQQMTDLKRLVIRDMLFEWGLTSLREEEIGDVMDSIETIIRRIRVEAQACSSARLRYLPAH